jgi:hypothetical protein
VCEVVVSGDVRVDAKICGPLVNAVDVRQPVCQAHFVAHYAGVLGHRVSDGAL